MTALPLLAAATCFTSENSNVTDQFRTQLDVFEGATRVSGLAEYAVLFIITISGLSMAVSQSIVTSFSRSRVHLCARQWIFVFRLILLVGAWGVVIAAYLKFNSLRKCLAASPWPSDDAEHKWDFGQLVPCFLAASCGFGFLRGVWRYVRSQPLTLPSGNLFGSSHAHVRNSGYSLPYLVTTWSRPYHQKQSISLRILRGLAKYANNRISPISELKSTISSLTRSFKTLGKHYLHQSDPLDSPNLGLSVPAPISPTMLTARSARSIGSAGSLLHRNILSPCKSP